MDESLPGLLLPVRAATVEIDQDVTRLGALARTDDATFFAPYRQAWDK